MASKEAETTPLNARKPMLDFLNRASADKRSPLVNAFPISFSNYIIAPVKFWNDFRDGSVNTDFTQSLKIMLISVSYKNKMERT